MAMNAANTITVWIMIVSFGAAVTLMGRSAAVDGAVVPSSRCTPDESGDLPPRLRRICAAIYGIAELSNAVEQYLDEKCKYPNPPPLHPFAHSNCFGTLSSGSLMIRTNTSRSIGLGCAISLRMYTMKKIKRSFVVKLSLGPIRPKNQELLIHNYFFEIQLFELRTGICLKRLISWLNRLVQYFQ